MTNSDSKMIMLHMFVWIARSVCLVSITGMGFVYGWTAAVAGMVIAATAYISLFLWLVIGAKAHASRTRLARCRSKS